MRFSAEVRKVPECGADGGGAPRANLHSDCWLREEVKALKDRIHVLERIAVEKEDTLSRQIEELRDR